MTENDITYAIRGAIFKVYKALGPELLESSYEATLGHEIRIDCKSPSQTTFNLRRFKFRRRLLNRPTC